MRGRIYDKYSAVWPFVRRRRLLVIFRARTHNHFFYFGRQPAPSNEFIANRIESHPYQRKDKRVVFLHDCWVMCVCVYVCACAVVCCIFVENRMKLHRTKEGAYEGETKTAFSRSPPPPLSSPTRGFNHQLIFCKENRCDNCWLCKFIKT